MALKVFFTLVASLTSVEAKDAALPPDSRMDLSTGLSESSRRARRATLYPIFAKASASEAPVPGLC